MSGHGGQSEELARKYVSLSNRTARCPSFTAPSVPDRVAAGAHLRPLPHSPPLRGRGDGLPALRAEPGLA